MAERNTRQILEDVAAGKIDPTEAAKLLDEATDASAAPDADASDDQSHDTETETSHTTRPRGARPQPPMVPEINRVQIRATSRRVRIVGDPTVATYSVEGPHSVRRDVSTLVITGESEVAPANDAFVLLAGGRWREVASQLQNNLGRDLELLVRVRPDLPVGVEVIAGSLRAEDVRELDHVRMTAGSVRVAGAESPLDVLVQAGSAQISTKQTHGHSRIRCESGSLVLTLLEGSDARVRPDVQLGRFVTQPEQRGKNKDVVVGTGAAEIDVEVVMGSVTVKTPGAHS